MAAVFVFHKEHAELPRPQEDTDGGSKLFLLTFVNILTKIRPELGCLSGPLATVPEDGVLRRSQRRINSFSQGF